MGVVVAAVAAMRKCLAHARIFGCWASVSSFLPALQEEEKKESYRAVSHFFAVPKKRPAREEISISVCSRVSGSECCCQSGRRPRTAMPKMPRSRTRTLQVSLYNPLSYSTPYSTQAISLNP